MPSPKTAASYTLQKLHLIEFCDYFVAQTALTSPPSSSSLQGAQVQQPWLSTNTADCSCAAARWRRWKGVRWRTTAASRCFKHFFGFIYPHHQANLAVFDKRSKLIADILLPGPEISGCAIRDGFIIIAEQSRKTLYRAAISGLLPTGSK